MHRYYNVNIICNKSDTTTKDIPAVYEDTTSYPIISRSETWQFALARVVIETNTIPMWIPNIVDGLTTTYNITMTATINTNSYSTTQSLQWLPNSVSKPSDDDYYWIGCINHTTSQDKCGSGFICKDTKLVKCLNKLSPC